MALSNIMHYDILDSLCRKFFGNSLSHLFCISIHTSVCDNYSLISVITAQTIIYTDHSSYIFCPHRSMSRTNSRNRKSAKFLQSLLYRTSVFTYDIRIVTNHFSPILIQINTGIQKATVYCTETSEAIAGEKNSVSLIKCHHRFRPMHHRGHVKAQFMAT